MHSLKNILILAGTVIRKYDHWRKGHANLRELTTMNEYMRNDIGVCRLHISGGSSAASHYVRPRSTGGVRRRLNSRVQTGKSVLRRWRKRVRARRELRQLDSRFLRDIGVTCLQARDEWSKPFWRS